MIIGIDASRANHKEKTGVEWYTWHIIQEMKNINMPDSVRVILYSDKKLTGELAILPENWQSRVLRWPPRRLWTQMRLSYEMLRRPPDVLFIPAHVFPLVHPKKTVMTVHDIAALRFPESYNWFERWYSVWSAKYAVKNLWRIITPTEFVKKELINYFHAREKSSKIKVVAHGFDSAYAKQNSDNYELVLSRHGLQKPYIMSLGRLEEKKNTKRIIEAFNLLKEKKPDLKLILVGPEGHGFSEVKKAYEKSPYKKDILLPGWLPVADTAVILQNASAFVFPSLYEGFGIPVLEAFASGIPVVAGVGSCLEEIGGEACLYADVLSAQDIAGETWKVLASQELSDKLKKAGGKRLANFSWPKAAGETNDVLLDKM